MNRRGFTLIETMVALVLLTIAVLSLGRFMASFQNSTTKSTALTVATTVAIERLQLTRSDPRYTRLIALYGTPPSSDTTGFPGYPTMHRQTFIVRDQTGAPARDFTTVTVRVTSPIMKDTVNLTAVVAAP